MERVLFYLRLFPGTEPEYGRRHEAIWPDLAAAIRESGLRNMSGFRRGTDVWYYLEAEPDAATAFAKLGTYEVNARWNEYFGPIIAEMVRPDGSLVRYQEMFHADGPPLEGPFQRGFLTLVVDPTRTAEYDERHANAWPEMIQAIVDSGFRNYSGFRLGSQVVYYGEYHPDMATVFGKIGRTDVNRRWGESFAGIITTITDADGNLITADEVFHQD